MFKLILIQLCLVLVTSLAAQAGQILKIKKNQAVIRVDQLDIEMGQKYYFLIKGNKKGKKKLLKKKILVKIIKTLNDKALIKIIKGRAFVGAKIVKVKPLKNMRRKKRTIKRGNTSKIKTQNHSFSAVIGLALFSPGAFVQNSEDQGYSFSLQKGIDFGLHYKIMELAQLRFHYSFAKGNSDFELIGATSKKYDTTYSFISVGGSYEFYKDFYLFADIGKASWGLETTVETLNGNETSKSIYSGTSYRVGLGYNYHISNNMNLLFEVSNGVVAIGSKETDIETSSSLPEPTIDYKQSLKHLSVLFTYGF